MIDVLATHTTLDVASWVLAALRRSVSSTQAHLIAPNLPGLGSRIVVLINPDVSHLDWLNEWKRYGAGKVILLGRLPAPLADALGLVTSNWPDSPDQWSRSLPAEAHAFAESPARIAYTPLADAFNAEHWDRPLERFDFSNEWNNLGYGAIRCDGSPWSLAQPLVSPDHDQALAHVELNGKIIATYAMLRDEPTFSTLWFNRAAGPIDSFEWRLMEQFLSSYRHDSLPCQPVLSDIPFGCDAAVTMRLDCDEDIESARPLRAVYNELDVPFTLAVHTTNLQNVSQHTLLKEMADAGESILSHTATHAPNWGGSYQRALAEGRESVALLEKVTGRRVKYAVSPFHQTPPYALAGLADAGLSGCIGGIICNDPEFLLARGGLLAGCPDGFIGHSQQHMLHGDCLLKKGDPLAISRRAFDRALETGTLFGFLDHPFSPRYQYGWPSEEVRIDAHREFIAHIRGRTSNVLFLSEDEAMDFILTKSEWKVISDDAGYSLRAPRLDLSTHRTPAIEYRGLRTKAKQGKLHP